MSESAVRSSDIYSAVYAKCRAKSATMLDEADYRAMVGMKNVVEVASYLVQNSDYKKELMGVNIYDIRRSQIETVLYKNLFNTYKSLYIFTSGELKEFISAMMRKYSIDVILKVARNITSEGKRNDEDEVIHTTVYSELHMPKISAVQSIEQLGEALKGTKYYKSYKNSFISNTLDYSIFEVQLYNEYYEFIYTKFVENKKTHAAASIRKILNITVDLNNLATILRMKRTFNIPPEKIFPYLLNIHGGRDKREYIIFCNMSKDDFMEYLRRTPYDKQLKIDKHISTSDYISNYLFIYYKKIMSTAIPSFEHPFAFLSLKEIEIKNLIHIIEGVRYNIPEQTIMDNIIIKH